MDQKFDNVDEFMKLKLSYEEQINDLSVKLNEVNKSIKDITDNSKLTLELASKYLDKYIGKIITFMDNTFMNHINIIRLTEYKLNKFSVKNIDLFYEKGFYYNTSDISMRFLAQGGPSSITIDRDKLERIKLYDPNNEFINLYLNIINEFNKFIG